MLCKKLTDGSHNPPPKQPSGYPVISAMNIKGGRIDLTLVQRFTNKKGFERENPRTRIVRGDIILGIIGGSIGNAAVYDHDVEVIAQRSIAIIDTFGLNNYCYWAIQSPLFFSYYSKASGTAQGGVYLGSISEMLIPIPPAQEQKRIILRIQDLLPLVDQYGIIEDARERLNTELPDRLRKSVLQLAVQGKLVEQDLNDEPASVLLERIRAERAKLVKEKKTRVPKGGESVIYRASDGGYYEKRGKGEPQPIDVPFDIPDTWEWVRLKTLGEIVGGGTPKTHDASLWASPESGVPWITPADMKNVHGGRVSHGERYISEKGLAGSSAQLMPAGTVVMSSRAPIGYLAIAECPIATNQGFKSVVPTQVNTNAWIMLALDALMDDIKRRASGTTFKEISGSEFGETLVPFPPLAEQARIIERSERSSTAIG